MQSYFEKFNQAEKIVGYDKMTGKDRTIKLSKSYCGYASPYEVLLATMATFHTYSISKDEIESGIFTKVKHLTPTLKAFASYCEKNEKADYVVDLIFKSPFKLSAPENKGKIYLGEANLKLLLEMLIQRLDFSFCKASSYMSVSKNNKYYPLKDGLKETVAYFEWYRKSSPAHTEFATKLVEIWRVVEPQVLTDIEQVLKEIKEKRNTVGKHLKNKILVDE